MHPITPHVAQTAIIFAQRGDRKNLGHLTLGKRVIVAGHGRIRYNRTLNGRLAP
jgi:hypothetical protein